MPLPPNTLNQALDQLPQLLLNLGRLQQDRRDEQLRREIQQASQDIQRDVLNQRIRAEEEKKKVLEQLQQGKERKDIFEARGKYGESGARAIYPEAYQRHFPQGLPAEKPKPVSPKELVDVEKSAIEARERVEETITGVRPEPKAEKTRLISAAKKLFAQKKASVPGTPFEVAIWGERPGWGDEESKELSGILRALKDVHLFEFSPAELAPLNLPADVLPPPAQAETVPLQGVVPPVEPTAAATTGTSISIPDHINPETDEIIRWNGSEWAPIE